MGEVERLTRERDQERRHVARLMRDLEHNRRRAELAEGALLASGKLDLALIKTALSHASFALDGVVALDDEDEGKNGGSATCQAAKKTVDRALASLTALEKASE